MLCVRSHEITMIIDRLWALSKNHIKKILICNESYFKIIMLLKENYNNMIRCACTHLRRKQNIYQRTCVMERFLKSQLMVMGENVLTKSKYLLWITSPALYDVEFTSISKGGGDFWASTPWPLGNMLIQAPSGGP